MGLDMYLYAEKYVSGYDYERVDGELTRRDNLEYDRVIEAAGMLSLPSAEYTSARVVKCVAYWRKANAIHGWIVRNCANGVDECQRIRMDRDDLIALRNACVEGLKSRDTALPNEPRSNVINAEELSDDNVVTSLMESFARETRNRNTVIVSTDDDPIPPVAGFFFGSTTKDKYYYEELAETAETINSILATEGDYDYYYQASW